MLFFFYDTNDKLFLQSPLRPAAVICPLGFLSPYHKNFFAIDWPHYCFNSFLSTNIFVAIAFFSKLTCSVLLLLIKHMHVFASALQCIICNKSLFDASKKCLYGVCCAHTQVQ